MLKFKRASREGMVSVIIRDKEPLFTRPFAIAFIIALMIHLSLILLFHVAPFNIGLGTATFPPTRVEAEAPSKESVLANLTPAVLTIRGLPSLPLAAPIISEQPTFLAVRPAGYSHAMDFNSKQAVFKIMHVSESNQEIYQPSFNVLTPIIKKKLNIIISGILAEQMILSDGLTGKSVPEISSIRDSERIVYAVMAEKMTGKIFWFEPKQSSRNALINQFAETLLRDMQFIIDDQADVMSGEIEFHFNLETAVQDDNQGAHND